MIPDLASLFPGRAFINVKEAALLLGVSDAHYYRGIKRGTLPGVATGPDRVVVPLCQLDEWMRNRWSPPSGTVREAVRVVTGIGGDR